MIPRTPSQCPRAGAQCPLKKAGFNPTEQPLAHSVHPWVCHWKHHKPLTLRLLWSSSCLALLDSSLQFLRLAAQITQLSNRQQLRGIFTIAVLCNWISIGVLMLHTLWWSPTFRQTQLKTIFHCHEEVLESHSCPVQETLQEMLLAGLQAAGHTVLIHTAAAIGKAAVTAVQLCTGHVDVTAAIDQQVLPLTDVAWKKKKKNKNRQSWEDFFHVCSMEMLQEEIHCLADLFYCDPPQFDWSPAQQLFEAAPGHRAELYNSLVLSAQLSRTSSTGCTEHHSLHASTLFYLMGIVCCCYWKG